MELNEQALIRVDEQLKTKIAHDIELQKEMSCLYDKLDKDSKVLAILRSDFKTHIEAYKAQKEEASKHCSSNRDDTTRKFTKMETHIDKLFQEIDAEKALYHDLRNTLSNISNKMDQNSNTLTSYIDRTVKAEATERESFQTKITTTLGNTKIFLGVLMFFFSLATSIIVPLITAVLKDMIVK